MSRSKGGHLTIQVINYKSFSEINVIYDGVGMEDDLLQQIFKNEPTSQSGIGLYNTNLRLKRIYGKGIHIQSKRGKGTKVSFSVPFNNQKEKTNENESFI